MDRWCRYWVDKFAARLGIEPSTLTKTKREKVTLVYHGLVKEIKMLMALENKEFKIEPTASVVAAAATLLAAGANAQRV